MKLHPTDVAKELKSFSFFRSFPEALLLQVATFVEAKSFNKGDVILNEGASNKFLYFLRSGYAEVVLAGEVVAQLQNVGEVIGEMSVVSGKPASSTIRAGSAIDAFVIDTENFSLVPPREKDHFLHILYRIYSTILADRLAKTNEKARLFEIANRELYQAQASLDKTGSKRVLLAETDKKQLALAKLALAGTGVQLDTSFEIEKAKEMLRTDQYDAIVADETCIDVLKFAYESKLPGRLVVMSTKDLGANLKLFQSLTEIDNIITRDPEERQLTMRMLMTTLTKVLSGDLFGLEKYLSWGVEVQTRHVKASTERETLKDEMEAYFKKVGIRSTILERARAVAEELLMNAIYDAPADSKGTPLYNHIARQQAIHLDTHHHSVMKYATDGVYLAVSVTDPFGSLSKDVILRYMEKNHRGDVETGEAGKGGAGKGLYQIVQQSDLAVFNVKRGAKTEVVCLFYVEAHKKEPQPSFHYFFV